MFNKVIRKIFKSREEGDVFESFDDVSQKVGEKIEEVVNPMAGMSREDKAQFSASLDDLVFYILSFLILAIPLFGLPILSSWFDLPKQSLLFFGTFLIAILLSGRWLLGKKPTVTRSVFDLPIILIVGVSLISAFASSNRTMAFISDPLIFLPLVVLCFVIGNVVTNEERLVDLIKVVLVGSAILAVLQIIQTTYNILQPVMHWGINFPLLVPGFSLSGSLLSQAMLLSIILPAGFGIYKAVKGNTERGFIGICLVVIILAIVATVYGLYQNRPILLPFESGWKIATGVMGQSLTTAIVGIGPNHFIDAFSLYKPLDFNNTPYWNLRFTTSSNYYFYILSTMGIFGLAALALLIGRFLIVARRRIETEVSTPLEKGLLIGVAFVFIEMVFLPAPAMVLLALFVFLGLLSGYYKIKEVRSFVWEDKTTLESWGFRLGLLVATVAALVAGGYFLGRAVLADYYYTSSLTAAAQNRGTDTYNLQIKALTTNPENDAYHVGYSQTNLALANVLASQPNISDQQKSTIVQLVQQAIREARLAVTLAPQRSGNYENLSLIYRNLINFAQGSDQWAISAQNQAVNLDPGNPRLRLDLGGIYLALSDFQTAGQIFAQAVNLKPDYANAHYNLAQAMKQLKLKDQATQQLQLTATLVCGVNPNSGDCQKVNNEISELGSVPATSSAETVTKSATSTGQLTPQAPLATPGGRNTILPKAAPKPPVKISSPGGEIAP